MPVWLIVIGAGYLAGSSAFLLAMGRAAARGDRHLAQLPPQQPRPADGASRGGDSAPCADASRTGGAVPQA